MLTSGRRTSYQPCPGNEPSHASARVDGFDARIEPHVLAELEDQLRILVSGRGTVFGDHHFGGDVAEADRAAFGLGDGFVGVGRHTQRVLILEGRGSPRAEVLADDAAQPEPFLEPVAAIDGELTDCGPGSDPMP